MPELTSIGIIGCGQISKVFFEGAEKFDDIKIKSCADINFEAAEKRAEEFGVQAVSVKEIITDTEIEIVVNLTIPKVHAGLVLQAVNAGKHTYSEKPIAISCNEAQTILNAARGKGVRAGCAPDAFLGGGHQAARKAGLGLLAIFMGYWSERYYHTAPAFFYDLGGGPMFALGPYYITALVNLLGPVKRISGCAFFRKNSDKCSNPH